MADRQNVLFIIIDQLRADCVAGAMEQHVAMPNLRTLMKESVRFERHFSVANPCGPSRASILTGQYAMNHRSVRNGTPLRHDTPNIATEMRKAGYLPMLFGYTDSAGDPRHHHPNDPAVRTYEYPLNGFHEMVEMRLDMSLPWQSHLINNGYQFDSYKDVYKPVPTEGRARRLNDPALYRAEHSDTAFLTNQFLNVMPAYARESWFAHLTYIRPHPPLVAPAPYNEMYDPDTLPLPKRHMDSKGYADLHPFFGPAQKSATVAEFIEGFPDLTPTDTTVQTLRAVYLGLATEVDHHIGRVVQFLKDSGQYEDTLLVITADHGEMLGDHHMWGKFSVYDAAYHTPLIIRMPGNDARAGTRIDVPTESIDLMPTILDWVGLDIPNSVDGRSLLSLVTGTQAPKDWRQTTFSELDFANPVNPTLWEQDLNIPPSNANLCILRDARFTLVEFADAQLPPLLFDHHGAGEMANVAQDPDYCADLMRLTQQMLRHRMQNMDHTLSMDMITEGGPLHFKRRP